MKIVLMTKQKFLVDDKIEKKIFKLGLLVKVSLFFVCIWLAKGCKIQQVAHLYLTTYIYVQRDI